MRPTPARPARAVPRPSSRASPSGMNSTRSGSSACTNSGVVAHDHHRPRPVAQRRRDRLARRRVEVVRRLVQQQEVVAPGDQLGQRQLRLLAARQRAGVLERRSPVRPNMPSSRRRCSSGTAGHLAHVLDHGDRRADALVLLRVVAGRDAAARAGTTPASASDSPARMRSSDVLPAPFSPSTSSRSPRSTVERHVVEHRRPAVALASARRPEHTAAAVRRRREPDAVTAARCFGAGDGVAPAAFDTRVSSVLALRARLAVECRIESASVDSRLDLLPAGARRASAGAPRPAAAPRGTASTCPGTRSARRRRGAARG